MTQTKTEAKPLEAKVLRGRLNAAFIEALSREWEAHGDEVLAAVWKDNPAKFAELVARLQPQQTEVEINNPRDYSSVQDRTELADRLIAGTDPNVAPTDKLRKAVLDVEDRAVEKIRALVQAAAEDEPQRKAVDEREAFVASGFKLL
jgi:hypothetical protein